MICVPSVIVVVILLVVTASKTEILIIILIICINLSPAVVLAVVITNQLDNSD